MAVSFEDFDEFDKVINDHIENVKLYAPNEARRLLTVWINMKAEILRKEINRDDKRSN